MNDLYNDNFPKCPYCGYEETNCVEESFPDYEIQNCAEIECGGCGKKYNCTGHISYYFVSSKLNRSNSGD